MGVVVRRYMDILIILLILTPFVLAPFCNSILNSLFIFKMFFRSLRIRTKKNVKS